MKEESDLINVTLLYRESSALLLLEQEELILDKKIIMDSLIRARVLVSGLEREEEYIIRCRNRYDEMVDRLSILDSELRIYETIVLLTGMRGIPRKIINNRLVYLESEVNSILLKFIKKSVHITKDIEDINIILINVDGSRCDFGGGMETFIITLGFKIALSEVFNSSRCGLLIIDENVSVLDKSHINKFTIISDFLKRYYNSILLITHIDGFQDYTIDKIDIYKQRNRAKVLYI
jgi:hypothetical protein